MRIACKSLMTHYNPGEMAAGVLCNKFVHNVQTRGALFVYRRSYSVTEA